MSRENEEIRNTREKCTSCCYWDQEDHCCWNLRSLKYRTEVGKDDDACEEYEPD